MSFYQPRRYAFWAYLLLLAISLVIIIPALVRAAEAASDGAWLVTVSLYAVWLLLPIWFIYRLDLFEREPLSLAVAAFVWGGFVATALAGSANNAIGEIVAKLRPDLAANWSDAFSGPTTEELLKALGVVMIILICREKFDRVLDGFIYGALVGLGFQVVENVLYALHDAAMAGDAWLSAVLSSFLTRGILTGLYTHAAFSSLVGAGIAYYVTRDDVSLARRRWVALGLFAVAYVAHFLHNSPLAQIVTGHTGPLSLVQTLLNGAITLTVATLIYRSARRQEYGWFRNVVADDVGTEVITEEEVAALATNSTRREAVKEARRSGGRIKAMLLRELQQSQLAYGVSKSGRAGDAILSRRREDIVSIRAQLAKLSPAEPPDRSSAPEGPAGAPST